MNKDELINIAAKKINAKSYLEIGHEFGNNFKKIDIEFKESLDPANDGRGTPTYNISSDEFFKNYVGNKKYDIIFIDGLHIADQVIKDINNSLNHINPNGIVFMHDCLPQNFQQQDVEDFDPNDFNLRPNGPKRKLFGDQYGYWTGNSWKSFLHYRKTRNDLYMTVVDTDWGVGVIFPNKKQDLLTITDESFEYFSNHKQEILNLISCQSYVELINNL